ncbi:hypothetical protein KC19_1G322100 [Ceratodon purpureus]|nr:hypothetical protein KC19_1G322100 [Ceratodon purpureus]KAG0593340.1 hypothetical protein KC19_1G322100 [Ceratodon purpureus]
MVIASCRVGKQMHKGQFRDNACGAHGHFAVGEVGEAISKTMANGDRLQICRKHRSSLKFCISWKFALLIGLLVVVSLGGKANTKGFQQNLDSFFCKVDQDGNGEIEQGEASKFLRKLDAKMADEGDLETKEGMSELIASSQFDFDFSYGGNTISAEEMLDHLSNMMTADHVVDWVTHGLQLPQYAEAFRRNAINGMDFPALIENDSEALLEDLGIKSTLHRTKVTHALVRQIFGIGTVPGPVRSLQCSPSSYGGIQLSWEAPINRGLPPLHKYLIERWSKTFSTWTNVADTREVAFLDRNAVKVGKEYTYRVQTWGGHGPSNWVTVDACRADVAPLSSSKLDVEDTLPLQMARQVSASLDPELLMPTGSKPSQKEESGMWTWINSGIILLLALASRHTFFFDVTLAAWVLLHNHLRQALMKGLESPHLCVRTAARSISLAYDSWLYMRQKIWALSRRGVDPSLAARRATLKSLSEPCMQSPFDAEEELNGGYFEAQDLRSISADNLLGASGFGASSLGASSLGVSGSGLQLSSGDSKGSSPNSSEREVELEEVIDKAVVFPPSPPPRDVELLPVPSKRSRNRCNHEGCKVRFDRWHSLQDWWMKLNKHYCRECQSVYCVKHTRISPHGPRGQCGLDSSCYCYNCHANLPSEIQRRLEEQNKLRVGPSVTSDSSSAANSLGSSKQSFGSSSNSSIAGAGLPPSLSDTVEPYLDSNGLLDFRDSVAAKSLGISKAASDSGMPDESSDRAISMRGHRKQRSFA